MSAPDNETKILVGDDERMPQLLLEQNGGSAPYTPNGYELLNDREKRLANLLYQLVDSKGDIDVDTLPPEFEPFLTELIHLQIKFRSIGKAMEIAPRLRDESYKIKRNLIAELLIQNQPRLYAMAVKQVVGDRNKVLEILTENLGPRSLKDAVADYKVQLGSKEKAKKEFAGRLCQYINENCLDMEATVANDGHYIALKSKSGAHITCGEGGSAEAVKVALQKMLHFEHGIDVEFQVYVGGGKDGLAILESPYKAAGIPVAFM